MAALLLAGALRPLQAANHSGAAPATAAPLPLELLKRSAGEGAEAGKVRRGQYLAIAGDCMSCHLRPGGEAFAGGLGLNTPFGVVYSSNITPDVQTGIGGWNAEQFYRAMHEGKNAAGENLYPAFPYPWFHLATHEDDDALFAYLKTVPPVRYQPPENGLHFPMSIRASVKLWNLLYLDSDTFEPDPQQSDEWNRGAYLVNGMGHCGGCHTPKNALGADQSKRAFEGGNLDNWVAPDLTSNERTGLGSWSLDQVTEYLRDGRNERAAAGGAMADVITYSTSLMTDADRRAIAVYLKSRAASAPSRVATIDPAAMARGAEIYSDTCASCHLENGVGQPRYFPPLGHDTVVQQSDPSSVTHLILGGTRVGTGPATPSALAMPSFAWKLSDAEIADVATFIRNSWGNQAPAVNASTVKEMRDKLQLGAVRLTVNSGDHTAP